jgi:hypothetical protein
MDSELLVEQKDHGKMLIEQLIRDGFTVSVAFWVRTSETAAWQLYIASPSVDEEKRLTAFRKVYSSLEKNPSKWVSPSEIKLLGDRNAIARAAIEIRDAGSASLAVNYRGKRLGDLEIECAYIYPEIGSARLLFRVHYFRNGDTNNWAATVKQGPLYRGVTTKGAVSYTTAQYAGETEKDQKFADVTVLVELDPRFDNPDSLREMLAEQARIAADEMFKSHHADAVIEHHHYSEVY